MTSLTCPSCKSELNPGAEPQSLHPLQCPRCFETLQIETYPAFWRAPQVGRTGELVTGEEAGCYVHAGRRAEAACDACGRFMCALCEVRVGENHLCVACLEEGRRGGRLAQVERSRTIYSFISVRVALFGILLGPFAPLAGMSAVVLGALGLTRPASVTGRRYIGTAAIGITLGLGVSLPWTLWWIGMLAA